MAFHPAGAITRRHGRSGCDSSAGRSGWQCRVIWHGINGASSTMSGNHFLTEGTDRLAFRTISAAPHSRCRVAWRFLCAGWVTGAIGGAQRWRTDALGGGTCSGWPSDPGSRECTTRHCSARRAPTPGVRCVSCSAELEQMIGPAMDEVLASLQPLSKRMTRTGPSGGSFGKVRRLVESTSLRGLRGPKESESTLCGRRPSSQCSGSGQFAAPMSWNYSGPARLNNQIIGAWIATFGLIAMSGVGARGAMGQCGARAVARDRTLHLEIS